jgi:hypothetical protein
MPRPRAVPVPDVPGAVGRHMARSIRAPVGCGPSLAVLLSREVEGVKGARSRASPGDLASSSAKVTLQVRKVVELVW